ncbi:nuclear pore complex component-domain-containing protein [Kalaharituber pfeilii]|nr:nuclear pore complex component-domain-containing protein [Kalaharituber pfeilii]
MSTHSTPYRSAPSTPNTGSWRHPAMDTIIERSKKKGSTDLNLNKFTKNLLALFGSYAAVWLLHFSLDYFGFKTTKFQDFIWLGGYVLNALRLLFIYNICYSAYRLARKEPDFSDLALTPSQRQLFGLPIVKSNALATGYVTPPRYPISSPASPSSIRGTGTSPSTSTLSSSLRSPSPAHPGSSIADLQSSPRAPSTLRQHTRSSPNLANSLGFSLQSERSSVMTGAGILDTPSPVGRGVRSMLTPAPGSASGGTSVPIGHRWVYENMGKRHMTTPGRNSVFSPRK